MSEAGSAPPLFWPFPVQAPLEEVLEWRTDVLATQAGEQRIALRPRPREILALRHRLDAHGMARAAELARAGFAGPWRVPLWHMATRPAAALAQGDTEIALDTTHADYRAPGLASIAVDGGEAALVAVTGLQPDRLVLAAPLDQQLPAATVAAHRVAVTPVRDGLLSAAMEIARRRQGDGEVRARVLLRDAPDMAAPALPLYLGLRVQTDPSLMRRPLSASLARAVAYVDNGFGPVAVEPARDVFARGESLTLKARGPAARHALRRWLWSLRGRQASFRLPTWGHELQLRAPMTAGSVLMRVAPVAPLGNYAGRPIMLEMQGALRFRTITAAIVDGPDHRLTLSSDLGVPVPQSTKVHFLVTVRADTDRVEIRHGVGTSEVVVPVVEVIG